MEFSFFSLSLSRFHFRPSHLCPLYRVFACWIPSQRLYSLTPQRQRNRNSCSLGMMLEDPCQFRIQTAKMVSALSRRYSIDPTVTPAPPETTPRPNIRSCLMEQNFQHKHIVFSHSFFSFLYSFLLFSSSCPSPIFLPHTQERISCLTNGNWKSGRRLRDGENQVMH